MDKTCELHGTILRFQKVPVRYGLPEPDPDLWEACEKLFPNANSFLLGGVGSSG